ncbi:MAG: hypothetical protein DDT42_01504 [candidate division WS2 bacterium]|uniref:Uncharacterized protein n=1 Tax=Psychracetigena formicireducens TaxID=2986056 RepID=A0A9E2BJI9_PSYF1|nr:hypothetical protein [Candidatus Psychracetigena formicireducens]
MFCVFRNGKEHLKESRIAFLRELSAPFCGAMKETVEEWDYAVSRGYHVQPFTVELINDCYLVGVVYTPLDRDSGMWGLEITSNPYPY